MSRQATVFALEELIPADEVEKGDVRRITERERVMKTLRAVMDHESGDHILSHFHTAS